MQANLVNKYTKNVWLQFQTSVLQVLEFHPVYQIQVWFIKEEHNQLNKSIKKQVTTYPHRITSESFKAWKAHLEQ
jgi:hypothetical protein